MPPSTSSSPNADAQAVIAAWEAWDEFPGDKARAGRLANARVAYAGLENSNHFQAHVATQRRAGLTVADAVYSWSPP